MALDVTTDTDALLATVREAQAWAVTIRAGGQLKYPKIADVLDSLAAELEKHRLRATQFDNGRRFQKQRAEAAEAELERVKAEKDETDAELYRLRMRLTEERRALNDLNEGHKVQEDRAALAEARLDKALSALREAKGAFEQITKLHHKDTDLAPAIATRAAARIAEIEGEA